MLCVASKTFRLSVVMLSVVIVNSVSPRRRLASDQRRFTIYRAPSNLARSGCSLRGCWRLLEGCHDTWHNDIQHKGLICDTRDKRHLA
jgi:hypothetical protein